MKSNQSQFALLGLLSLRPMSGYDLKQLSSWSVGHFWREGYGQIYPALKKMTLAGLISRKTARTSGRPDRHVYSLTSAGRKDLNEWLGRPAAAEVPRNELLLKLFFGGLSPVSTSREHVVSRRERSEQNLVTYASSRKRLEKECAKHPQKPFWLMTLNYGEHMAKASIAWCDTTLSELNSLAEAPKQKKQRR